MITKTTHRLSSCLNISRIVLIAGAAAGLAAARPCFAQQQAEPGADDVPMILWQLAMLSPEEFAELTDDPAAQPDPAAAQPPAAPKAPDAVVKLDSRGRRIQPDEPTVLAFKNVTVEQVIPFIVETTGKVVFPMPDVLSLRITVLNDQKISRAKALDMVFLALLQNGVAVVENEDRITLRSVAEIDRADLPVIGPDQSVRNLSPGTFVEKVFLLHHASAANVADMFKNSVPTYAKLTFDADSNQIVVMGDVALIQRYEARIEALDIASSAALETETFPLKFSDASDIAQNIKDLFAPSQNANRQGNNQNPFAQFIQNRGGGGGGGGGNQPGGRAGGAAGATGAAGGQRAGGADAMTSQNLRVTANTQQNAVTVLAEKPVLEEIRKQITQEWDIKAANIAPRVYELKNTDPVKMRDVLISMFGSPGAKAAGNQQQSQTANRLYGQFTFEAIPDASRLVVIAKNQSYLDQIDEIIKGLDKPQNAGLPRIVELKHADAEQLAEQLNALLAREGTIAQVTKAQTGLTTSATATSPFSTAATTTAATTTANQANAVWTQWWARAQPPTTTAGSGNLVGKIRIVPVWRQNALMILSPPEYKDSLADLIQTLDNPGRQVLLSAVIAEINVEDATALGLRWANSNITPANADNAISFGPSVAGNSAGGTVTGVKTDLLPGLFTSSVLNLGVNVNAIIQALNEKTSVNILSEPRIFTSDNQEAEFFSGQDIPFITQSQPATGTTALVQNFDYRAVGIALRVRPRITINHDVDININLELSSTQPGNTLFGGAIVDRRETTTHLIIRDGQTVVVSGILRTEDSDTKRKVPFLGDLPLIGAAFTSVERTKTKTELIAFVTPYVVGSDAEVSEVDRQDQIRLKQVRERLQPVVDLDAEKGKNKKIQSSPRGPGDNPE